MRKLVLLASFSISLLFAKAQVHVENLLCENKVNPIGMGEVQPRLSWQLHADKRGVLQTAYEIKITADAPQGKSGNSVVWQTGKVMSGQSVQVPYGGSALESGRKYYWQVRVWDNTGKASPWSEQAWWQMGLLHDADWKAQWIEADAGRDDDLRPSPLLRKEFTAGKTIKSATAYITSHGFYEAYINGKRVGDAYLTPGWTSYKKRLQYQAYDVTDLLRNGSNAIGVLLGNGWYRGYIAFQGQHDFYGKDVALLLQLNITYTDGTRESVVSDGTWKSSTGAIRSAEIYHGEIYDARKEKNGWDSPGYQDQDWQGVTVKDYPKDILVATVNEPVRKHEVFHAIKIFTTPKGEHVVDFGQNLVGWVQLNVNGQAGDTITLSHAEVLDKEGNFYTENLRAAKAQDRYIVKGGGQERFEPQFTWHGFRYVRVDGYPGELKPEDITAVAVYSDMKPTGSFSTSNALLNQLQHNIQWGQRGNFLDVPTDCPQRDERLGWTGDAQVFSRTASFNMNVNNFFAKWLKDVAADQNEDGSVPFVIPNVLSPDAAAAAGWADVATIVPWNMYLAYGDKTLLENQYSSMKAWVDFMRKTSVNDLWTRGNVFGDWLFYRPFDDNDGRSAVTDKSLISECFFAHSLQLVINVAHVLGKTEDSALYTEELKKVKEAFLKEFVTPNGRLASNTQTAYVLALNFDMLPESLRAQAAQRLAKNVHDYNNHLTTGFLGTPYLCHVLTRFGYTDVAYKLLLQDTYPSWLYPVKMGATTIWERWDGEKPDSTFQTPGMNSFNHYAYGAIGDWMYRVIAGLDTYEDGPGYKHIKIMPHIGGGLKKAAASLKTYYGNLNSEWETDNGGLKLNIEIPANTRATVFIPADDADKVREGNRPLQQVKDIEVLGKEGDYIKVEAGSGKYAFSVQQ